MNTRILSIALSGLVAFGGASVATAGTRTHHLQAREARQERRIEHGVANGKINARQDARLDKREGRITRRVAAAKASGHVGPRKRRHLRHELNHTSRAIRRDKN